MGYKVPPYDDSHPAVIAARLMDAGEFQILREGEARIGWMMRSHPEIVGGRQVLGSVHMPRVQGRLKELFDWMLEQLFPDGLDFLVILDAEYWLEAGPREREILVFHELCHAVQKEDRYGTPRFDAEGRPVWGLKGHDVEEFSAVVERYGAWSPDLREFISAAAAGGKGS